MHVIVRTTNAGVFAGQFISRKKDVVVLHEARRMWQWHGAATLSQLAVDGTSAPTKCKFPVPVPYITLLGVIEIIPTTAKAEESIGSVPVWSV